VRIGTIKRYTWIATTLRVSAISELNVIYEDAEGNYLIGWFAPTAMCPVKYNH